MNLILLGKPGSGKGSQGALLEKQLGLYFLQSGDLARELAKNDERLAQIMTKGDLIPESEMSKYIFSHLAKDIPSGENILFEGWPRFVTQYQDLEKWLAEKDSKIDAVILLNTDESTVIRRLGARRVCEKCGTVYNLVTNPPPGNGKCKCGGKLIRRSDDNPQSIRERFKVYQKNTAKVAEHARALGQLIEVDATRSIEEVNREILEKLRKFKTSDIQG